MINIMLFLLCNDEDNTTIKTNSDKIDFQCSVQFSYLRRIQSYMMKMLLCRLFFSLVIYQYEVCEAKKDNEMRGYNDDDAMNLVVLDILK